MLGRWSVAALRRSRGAGTRRSAARALSSCVVSTGSQCTSREASDGAFSGFKGLHESSSGFLGVFGSRACSSEAGASPEPTVPKPTEEELAGDRHFIEHELAYPMVIPEDDQALQNSVEWIWDKAGKDDGKEIVEAAEAWMAQGNLVSRALVDKLLVRLCSREQYLKAFMLVQWAIKQKYYEITEHDYILLLHLASMHGKHAKASIIFTKLSNKTEFAYERVLRPLTRSSRIAGAEAIMNQMKEAKVITSAAPYNHMISMYLCEDDFDKAKQFFSEMEASDIEPDAGTYRLLVSRKEKLDLEGLEDKAESFLSKLPGKKLKGQEWKDSIRLYAVMNKSAGVKKLWEDMSGAGKGKKKKFVPDAYFFTAAEAFSILGDMSKFEELYTAVATRNQKVTAEQCFAMVRAYTDRGMLDKAEAVLETARDNKYEIPFVVFLPLIQAYMKLYQKPGDTKAYAAKAARKFQDYLDWRHSTKRDYARPMFAAVPLLMEAYASIGDVTAAERLVTMVRKSHKYPMTMELFNKLLKVYAKTQSGMYGIEERMKHFRGEPDEETEKYLKRIKPLVAAVV